MEIEQQESNGREQKVLDEKDSRRQRCALRMIVVMTAMTQTIIGLYIGLEREPSRGITLLAYSFLFCLGAYWLEKDSRRYKMAWIYDSGLFLTFAWPIIMPVYLFKTRGIRAILIILVFLGIYIGALVIGTAIGMTLQPEKVTDLLASLIQDRTR
jgi:hypothetical protein